MSEIYEQEIEVESKSVFTGERKGRFKPGDDEALVPWDAAVVKAFLEDDDLQQMEIVSTSIGFIKTLRKSYKNAEHQKETP